MNEFCMNIEL